MRILATVPITYEGRTGETSHAPMIVARVGGVEARLVLDTGSEVHLLTEDLVDELGLSKEPGEEGIDHSGATMPSWTVEEVGMHLGGLDVVLDDVVAIPAPAAFVDKGIRGILSPHNLHPTAMTMIDMASDELLLVEGTHAEIADLLRSRSPSLTLLTLPRDANFSSVVVPASIPGFAEMPTLLNTGGRGTEFSSTALPGLEASAPERLGGGVSGADYKGGSVGPRTLLVSGKHIPIPNLRIRESMHDPQGMVGMDVLRGTVLACATEFGRPVYWSVRATQDV